MLDTGRPGGIGDIAALRHLAVETRDLRVLDVEHAVRAAHGAIEAGPVRHVGLDDLGTGVPKWSSLGESDSG